MVDESVFEGGKKRFQFDLTSDQHAELERLQEVLGLKSKSDLVKTALASIDKEVQEAKTAQLRAEEIPLGGPKVQQNYHAPDEDDPFDNMMKKMEKMMNWNMMMQFQQSMQTDQGGGGGISEKDRMYMDLQREKMDLQRQDRKNEQMQQMMLMQAMTGKDGGDDGLKEIMGHLMKQQEESDRKWAEFYERQEKIKAEEATERRFQQLESEKQMQQQQLVEMQERHHRDLLEAQQQADARMAQQLAGLEAQTAKQDGLTDSLESFARMKNAVDVLAEDMGYQKRGTRVALPKADTPPPQPNWVDGLATATGLIQEVRGLMHDGKGMVERGEVPAQQTTQGMPRPPAGPPTTQGGQPQQITPPLQRNLPEIDPELEEMRERGQLVTETGVPLTDDALKSITLSKRAGNPHPIHICDTHGEVEPCPRCATYAATGQTDPPIPAKEPGPEEPLEEPPVPEPPIPDDGVFEREQPEPAGPPCNLCGNMTNKDGSCPVCIEKMVSFVPKYQPLIKQLHDAGLDIAPISDTVDIARNYLENNDYASCQTYLESAAQQIEDGFKQLRIQAAQPHSEDDEAVPQPDVEPASVQRMKEVDQELQAIQEQLIELREQAPIDEALQTYNEAVGKLKRGFNDEASELGRKALAMAKERVDGMPSTPIDDYLNDEDEGIPLDGPDDGGEEIAEIAQGQAVGKGADAIEKIMYQPETVLCEVCNEEIDEDMLDSHRKSVMHKENLAKKDDVIDVPIHNGVSVPDIGVHANIVRTNTGTYGRLREITPDNNMVIVTNEGEMELSPDDLHPGICVYCGKNCTNAAGRAMHEKSCHSKEALAEAGLIGQT